MQYRSDPRRTRVADASCSCLRNRRRIRDESSSYESSVSGSELYFGLADAESYDSSESGWLPEDYGIAINEINEANQADEDEDFYDAPACALCGCDESEMMWLDDKFVTCCECVG